MDHTQLTELQQNPNPSYDPYSSNLYTTNPPAVYFPSDPYQQSYYPSNNTIDPHNALLQARPPGVDQPYVPPPVTATAVTYAQQPLAFQPQQSADATAAAAAAAAAYHWDPNVGWTAAMTQYAAAPYAPGVSIPTPAIQPQRSSNKKKGPKKTKIVQSAWCEICSIYCNSKDVLDQHKLGMKHKKNIEKLKVPTATVSALARTPAPAPAPALASTPAVPAVVSLSPAIAVASIMPLPDSSSAQIDKPIIGPEENPDKAKLSNAQKARKKAAAARSEDLETKKRKVLEGGAEAQYVRTCIICNVVCNSETVFNYHLAGQKHASMIKKHAASAAVASAL